MQQIFILFLFSFLFTDRAVAIDVGDGSDGNCVDGTFVSTKKYYQCVDLTITGPAPINVFSGTGPGADGATLVIKVQQDVTIANGATIDLSGANGNDGNSAGIIIGGKAGAGGGAGGNSTATNGANGNGTGGGTGGTFTLHTALGPDAYAGGGGGGSYGTQSATQPLIGDNDGAAVAAGVNGITYFPEINFDTNFSGGSGGAAGGTGTDLVDIPWYGSSGGGGGGAIRIISGGNITIDGTVISSGGNGGGIGTVTSSGGGGGGSGGAIWLQAAGTLSISATGSVIALGSIGGINASGLFGFGGDGGLGRIRMDDADGAITNNGTVTPAIGHSTTFTPTAITSGSSTLSRQYSSSVACGRVSLENEKPLNNLVNLIFGMIIASVVYFSISRKGKI